MWDFSSEVQWWDEWQLQILVLGSLFLQFILFIGSLTRHVRALKSFMWLAYIVADAVAIYGLTTLFNRHKTPPSAGGAGGGDDSALLEVMWAPVLLLHLGGQHTFTAYSLEDNELWGRHLVTLASQVTVAIYVFYKSWPSGDGSGDRRLLVVAILLFVAGILKFFQKPWALRAASIQSLQTSSFVYPQRRSITQNGNFAYVIFNSCLMCSSGSVVEAAELRDEDDHDLALEEYVQKARDLVLVTQEVDHKFIVPDNGFYTVKRFVDLSDPYSRRLTDLSSFLKLDLQGVVDELRRKIGLTFLMIYTDAKMVFGIPGILLKLLLLPSFTLSSAVLFGCSRKDGYRQEDVIVTYILLWCTASLSFLPLILCPCIIGAMLRSTTAAQHNLVSFAARQRKPTMLMKLSNIIGFKDYINKHWYITHQSSSVCSEVISLVLQHVKHGWKQYIVDDASYRRFNNLRGQWSISRHKQVGLMWSLKVSFDHSVLIWHVATQLCLHQPSTTVQQASSPEESTSRQYSEVISNYMIYLLLIRREMLMPGTRQALFTNTGDDIEVMLKHVVDGGGRRRRGTTLLPEGRRVARRILRAAKSPLMVGGSRVGPWILKACKLAEDLMDLPDAKHRWMLIQGVWVEMLCYSASRCRGYQHAKAMGQVVEFLTHVWLLWSCMGMETFADKFQRPDPTQGEDPGDASASQPQDRVVADEDAITIDVE